MSEIDRIKKQRALYLKEDIEYRDLINAHQRFSKLILSENVSPESLEAESAALNIQCQKMQTILRQAALTRRAKAANIESLEQKTAQIKTETDKRVKALSTLSLESKQAEKDAKAVHSLQPIIEKTLQYPPLSNVEKQNIEAKEQLKAVEDASQANEEFLENWRNKSSMLVGVFDNIVCIFFFFIL